MHAMFNFMNIIPALYLQQIFESINTFVRETFEPHSLINVICSISIERKPDICLSLKFSLEVNFQLATLSMHVNYLKSQKLAVMGFFYGKHHGLYIHN